MRGFAPAKLILFGEHSVAYGQPAIGVGLARGVTVELRRGNGALSIRAPGAARGIRGASPEALVSAALGKKRRRQLDVRIRMDVPPGAGLGTSAALAIAILRAEGSAQDGLLEQAIAVENLAHGSSSGLDPSICLEGGRVIRFVRTKRGRSVRAIPIGAPIHLAIGVLGTHGGTAGRVAGIASLMAQAPDAIRAAMNALGAAAELGGDALRAHDLARLAIAIDLAHGLLAGLGLVPDPIEALVRLARGSGALAAKMSGAGGGGAFYALASSAADAARISRKLRRSGALAFRETIGGS